MSRLSIRRPGLMVLAAATAITLLPLASRSPRPRR